ncbi:hypothetical protein [Streptomyces mangrovisoli]|uniref:Uncharacterized protein n=1 Tax=Streptomyces mangrovisoli TaxID=1428628 RepID=A0A1J4P2J5_9ACTN|nr:hypothetical protein [Streptomyces mangrovisoli]OIJ67964.1 hypothetical protein WN71_010475 [Streptomyces mangrovisoli]
METKTVDEAGAEAGAEATEEQRDQAAEKAAEAGVTTEADAAATEADDASAETDEDAQGEADIDEDDEAVEAELAALIAADEAQRGSGVGQGAAAVVSTVLGLVSLNGGWIGSIAAARQTLVGQLHTSSTASVATQIKAVYGDAWHTTAIWAGIFALLGLVTGVVTLAIPAFGARRPQAPWIKSVAWAGVALGVIGLLLAVLKYSDALLSLPSAS